MQENHSRFFHVCAIARNGAPNAIRQGGAAVKNVALNTIDLTSDAA